MTYKLINPSDPYTFRARSREIAALTVFVLGTQYGAEPQKNTDEGVPVFILGGASEWYIETFGRTPDEGLHELRRDVIDALESFVLGDFVDRKRYDAALAAIDDQWKAEQFMEQWQDGRSSCNDIGGAANAWAKTLREREAAGI